MRLFKNKDSRKPFFRAKKYAEILPFVDRVRGFDEKVEDVSEPKWIHTPEAKESGYFAVGISTTSFILAIHAGTADEVEHGALLFKELCRD